MRRASLYIYEVGFKRFEMGYAALSLTPFAILIVDDVAVCHGALGPLRIDKRQLGRKAIDGNGERTSYHYQRSRPGRPCGFAGEPLFGRFDHYGVD